VAKKKRARASRKRKAVRRKPRAVSRKPRAVSRQPRAVSRKPQAGSPQPSAAKKAAVNVKGAIKGAVVAFTSRLPGSGMDAITLLETDHRRLEELLKRGEGTTDRAARERKTLLDTIAQELTIHETIEERILYPALKQYPEARDIVLEGFQEHHVADLIMKELFDTPVTDEEWGAKFKVFKENIEHHIKEEEGPMFRTARGVMDREELLHLGAKMAEMKVAAEKGRL
jgi:Hemerythrin HHE cation binding domain